MVINTEAGSYAGFPRSDIDMAFDASTLFPGLGIAEKMTAGGYLGGLCKFMLDVAAKENVFATRLIEEEDDLRTEDISEYLESGTGVIAENLWDEEDERDAAELLTNLVLRAARLVAVQMAAMAVKSKKTNGRVLMSVEGTTYEKLYGLKEEVWKELSRCLEGVG
jgi:hexokinase